MVLWELEEGLYFTGDVRGRRREKEKDIMVSAFGENVVWIRMKQMVGMMMAACVVNHST